jgi:hypothetical protein
MFWVLFLANFLLAPKKTFIDKTELCAAVFLQTSIFKIEFKSLKFDFVMQLGRGL